MRLKAGGGEKVVLSPNCRVSWQPRGFEAPPAHSSGLGPLVPPKFSAETLAKGSRFTHGDTPLPRMWRKPACAMQAGIFPCRSQERPSGLYVPGAFKQCSGKLRRIGDGLLIAINGARRQAANANTSKPAPPPNGYRAS